MKKILTFLLVSSMLMTMIPSCSNDTSEQESKENETQENQETTTDETEPPETLSAWDSLEKIDYEGYTFNILFYNSDFMSQFFEAEEITGEVINDTVRDRNLAVGSLYNVDIVAVRESSAYWTSGSATSERMINDVMSGSREFDIAYQWADKVQALTMAGALYNILDIKEIDTTAAWWNQNFVESFQIVRGKLYCTSSAINVNHLYDASGVFFNREIIENYKLDEPYELVADGKWTLENMYNMMSAVASDLNGDGTQSADDMYGAALGYGGIVPLWTGPNALFAVMDENDRIVVNFANEKELKVAEWIDSVMKDTLMTYNTDFNTSGWPVFNTGNCLFVTGGISTITSMRDSVEFNFGVLPGPKYDESQQEYYSACGGTNSGLLTISSDQENPSRTGNIIEAMSIYSNDYLFDAYVEITLGGKIADTPETRDMMNLVMNSAKFDTGLMLFPTIWQTFAASLRANGAGQLTSAAASIEKQIENEFDTIVNAINDLE